MSNAKDFVIHEGVLIKYKGDLIDDDFVFPEGIIGIGNNAFQYVWWDCDRLVIPKTVETIGNRAFFKEYFPEDQYLGEIIVQGDIKEIGKNAFSEIRTKKILFEGHVGKIGESAFAHTSINTFSVVGGIDAIGKNAFLGCRNLKMIDTPWIGKIGKDVFAECKKMDVDAVYELLNNKPNQSVASTADKKPKQLKTKLSAAEEALCEPWRSIYDEKTISKTFTKLKGNDEYIAGVKLTDGATAPSYLVKCAIVPYAEQLTIRPKNISEYKTACYETKLIPQADQAAALLDKTTLLNALKQLRSAGSAAWLIPYGRYADIEHVKQLLSNMQAWGIWDAFGGTGRGDIIIARGALLLSDTKEAVVQIDKVGQLAQYAELRGTDADTIRDTVLSEFGFDENRMIRYDLGDNAVVVTIGADLTLQLTDEATGKKVKSVPKKNSDPELYKTVNSSIRNLKKEIKSVVDNRKKLLLAEYLSGERCEIEKWKNLYLQNPVLNAVARLVVWGQDGKTFTLAGDGAVDCNGEAYTIGNTPVCVAHPVEVGDQLSAWRNYFVSRGLKQPFEQIWEPAYKKTDLSKDRFKGCVISAHKVQNKELHGIHTYGFRYYSDDCGFTLTDCTLSYEENWLGYYKPDKDNKMTLGEFSFQKLTRYVNHIAYLFDKWTVSDRILADDASIASVLPRFTLAQITEFIKLASENNCPNVTAILLDFQQKNFSDYDPMVEFTLE